MVKEPLADWSDSMTDTEARPTTAELNAQTDRIHAETMLIQAQQMHDQATARRRGNDSYFQIVFIPLLIVFAVLLATFGFLKFVAHFR
jgi:hypothetical protein